MAEKTVTVQIGKLSIRLSALSRKDRIAAEKAWNRVVVSILKPQSDEWFKAREDALGFIFIAARKNHPELRITDLDSEATPEEIEAAGTALIAMSAE